MSDEESDLFESLNNETEEVPIDNKNQGQIVGDDGGDITKEESEEEKRLQILLFGDKEGLIKRLDNHLKENKEECKNRKRKPAWNDSDDEENCKVGEVLQETRWTGSLTHLNKEKSYKKYLTNKFERIVIPPKWADLNRDQEVESDEEILKTVGHISKNTSETLPQNNIQFKRLKDLNRATYAEGSVSDVQFHHTSTAALVSGYSGIATIYSIDGQKNDKLHSVQFKNFPIKCTRLLHYRNEVLFGSNKNYCYSYDLMEATETRIFLPKVMTTLQKFEISPDSKYIAAAGRFGEIHLLDLNTKELIYTLKQENRCTAISFSLDSKKIFAHADGSNVTIFDIRQQKVEHIFSDDGCLKGRCLSISPNNHLIATGSNEGVVNIYNYNDVFKSETPEPQKIIYNLTTAITATNFNHTGEILGICSEAVAGAMKLVHFPSGTVFANYPGFQTNIGRIRRVEFSPNSGFLALGNTAKEVPLFRLKHFKNY